MQGREEYQLNISNMSAALESLDGSGGTSMGLEKTSKSQLKKL
jgi:hypothetical protein